MKTYELTFTIKCDEDTDSDRGYDQARIAQIFNRLKSDTLMKKMHLLTLKDGDPVKKSSLYHIDKDLDIIDQMIDTFNIKDI